MTDIKSILYAWCGKKKCVPEYEFNSVGPKHKQRFKCEVRVEGFNYVAVGNSTNKKDAQANAARDYCQHLVRQGLMAPAELPVHASAPAMVKSEGEPASLPCGRQAPHVGLGLGVPIVTQQDPMREYPRYERGPPQEYLDRLADERRVAESEDVDLNADLHGNWTLENAKSRLHQFLQMNKIQTDYKYSVVGPDHNRLYF